MKRIKKILWDNPFLILLSFIIIAYLPVLLPFFHLKNDLITQNLPTRFVISESLHSGFFPWWNPFIHFGIPQYGDMNNGFWNPFLWLIASTFGYSISSITMEEIFYILTGGWGIYKLVKEFGSKEIALLTGLAYMSCGYILGHLQHFIWITGTAFFPYVIFYFIKTNKNPILKNFIAGGFAIFFFLAATHPGLIIGGLYFFLFLIAVIYSFRKTYFKPVYNPNFWKINIVLFIIGTLISFVVIRSNLDVLANISRGNKVSADELLMFPTTFQSYLSLLVPLAVQKSAFFNTDISMRNIYFGLVHFAGLVLFYRFTNKKFILVISACLLFFILLSAGGIYKSIFSAFLPGLGYVRLNGEFSYFVILILLLLGAVGLEKVFSNPYRIKKIQLLFQLLKWILLSGIIISTLLILTTHSSLFFSLEINSGGKLFIKNIINTLSSWDLFLLSCIIQIITIILLQKKMARKKSLITVTTFNLIMFTWLILPFTGLGMSSRAGMQQIISSFPKGIHAPELESILSTNYIDSSYKDQFWLLASYSKKIGYPDEEKYPVQLTSTAFFFNDSSLHQFINNQSWVFLSTDTTQTSQTNFDSTRIKILSFGPGYVRARITNDKYRYLILLQNDYRYWIAKVNGKKVPHFTVYKTFIGLNIPDNISDIEIRFDPKPIRKALFVSLSMIVMSFIILFIKKWRNYPLFKS